MRQIKRLSDSVVNRLRSGTILSDIAQIAEELVCNSIDAGATKIQIDVEVEACLLKVDDDGCGINRDDLTVVGERHARGFLLKNDRIVFLVHARHDTQSTSKLHDLEELEVGIKTLGFRGEALSSLSDIALVEITSRCRGTPNTYRKLLKDCATVSIGLCSQQRSHGTTVVVKDMFYNQPVRRRLMNASHRKILLSVKERIVRFILMHPSISFKVTDLARSEVSVHSKSATSLSITLCGMFGKELLHSLEEIDRCEGPLKIAGYLSRKYQCLSSKTVQFIYINRRFVKKTPIHKLLNKWSQSSKNAPRSTVVPSTQRLSCGGRGAGKQDGNFDKHLLPAFVLNLTCPLSEYDITFEASKTVVEFKDWVPVVDLMRSVIQSVWGNFSDVPEGGLIDASGGGAELSVKLDARSKIIRQQTSCVPYTGSKCIIPPMSVRRALVQGGPVDLCSPKKGRVEHTVGEFANHSLRPSRSRTRDSVSPANDRNGGRGERRYHCEALLNASETIGNILTKSSSHGSDKSIPERRLLMASCGHGEMVPKPVPLSDTIDLCAPGIQAPGSPSASDGFTNLRMELSPDITSVTSSSMVERFRSFSDIDDNVINHSLVETCTANTSGEGVMEHSLDLSLRSRLPEENIVKDCASMELETGGTSLSVPDLNMGGMLWSGSDDSYNDMSSPDSSYFLSEVRSRPSSVSDVQENLSWTVSGSDESRCVAKDELRTIGKRCKASEMCGPDNVSTNYFVCDGKRKRSPFKDCSKDVSLPGQSEQESWNVHTDASEAHKLSDHQEIEQLLQERSLRRVVRNYSGSRRPSCTSHQDEFGKSSYPSRPQVKRKLELFSCVYTDDFGSRSYYRDDPESSVNDFDQSSHTLPSKRERRTHSGPPFYQPPNRCGLQENPPNSLSTTKKESVDILEDTNPRKKGIGAKALERDKSTGQGFQRIKWPMDMSSYSSFRAPSPRKGLELDADDSVEGSHTEEDWSTRLTEQWDTPAVTPVQLELPDVTGRGQNEAATTNIAIEDLLKEWSNPCMKNDEGVLDLSSGILCWNSVSILPDSIVKESLQYARILQQVDKKFIPAVADGVLLMIDQHAADERVRLEELRDQVLGSGQMKQASPLSCTQELTMAFTEQQMLQTYREQIEDWGWRFRLPFGQSSNTARGGSSVVGMCNVLLSAVPCILGVMLTGDDLTEYLRQLMDTQGSSAPPPAVIRVLNYKSCRGAIMFGDTLLPAESRQLIEHLKRTSLCFQCAHGRPTMIPLVDLRALRKRLLLSDENACGNVRTSEMPGALKSGSLAKEWHGLQNKKSSLQRSLERVTQARP